MNDGDGLSLLEHIEELRQRIIHALIGLAVGMLVSALFAEQILEWLARPLPGIGMEQLEAIEVTENVGVFMQAVLLGGITLAMPWMLYQLWRFIDPALLPHEKRYVVLLAPMATLLFLSGAAFCYFIMMPVALPFLIGFLDIPTRVRPSNYFSFITSLLLWIGVSFETPLVIFFLAKVRIVNHRMLIRGWRVALILIAVLAAVITPTPDPINMGIVMIPLVILYGLSIILAWVASRSSREAAT
jgi:sec-independent protein translocase protein TatC